MMKYLAMMMVAFGLVLSACGGKTEEPATPGEAVDAAIESVNEAGEEAGEAVGEAVEDAGEAIEEAGDAVQDATSQPNN